MIKLIVGSLVLLCALVLSGTAGVISVVGMNALFPAGGILLTLMIGSMEGSKLLAAGWLHAYWTNPKAQSGGFRMWKAAMIVAIMLLTSIGIYGFLSKAHFEQAAPTSGVAIQIETKQLEIDQLLSRKAELATQQGNINKTIDSYIASGKANGASAFMRQQKIEQARISSDIVKLDTEINTKRTELLPLKQEISAADTKLGPLKYVADLFGWKDPSAAVKLIILLIMFAFDPFAVVMMISGTITLAEWQQERKRKSETVDIPEVEEKSEEPLVDEEVIVDDVQIEEPNPIVEETVEEPVEEPMVVEEPVEEPKSDREIFLALLEKNPELIDEVVQAVDESRATRSKQWLDVKP